MTSTTISPSCTYVYISKYVGGPLVLKGRPYFQNGLTELRAVVIRTLVDPDSAKLDKNQTHHGI